MIITLEKQKKGDRLNLFLDGEFFSGICPDQVVKYNLKNGEDIEKDEIEKIVLESETFFAFNKVLKFISKSMKSEDDVKDYLKQKQFCDKVIENVVKKLKEYNYIDDKIYAKCYIESYKNRYGKSRLKINLKNKKISEEIIEEVLKIDEDEEIENIKRLILKQIKNKEIDAKMKDRIYRNLFSRGYSLDSVKKALNLIGEENESWDWFDWYW